MLRMEAALRPGMYRLGDLVPSPGDLIAHQPGDGRPAGGEFGRRVPVSPVASLAQVEGHPPGQLPCLAQIEERSERVDDGGVDLPGDTRALLPEDRLRLFATLARGPETALVEGGHAAREGGEAARVRLAQALGEIRRRLQQSLRPLGFTQG